MDLRHHSELLEGVVNQLIDEEALGVCFEMHRAIKLSYYELLYPDDSVYEKQPIVDQKGLDIFGNDPQYIKKNVDCLCPNCGRTLGAQKFAPHLEKCMGMGRNSSRLANKKQKTPVDSEQEPSDDNEDEWTYPERKSKKLKKEKNGSFSSPSRGKSGRGPGRPPKHPRVEEPPSNSGSSDFLALKPSLQQHNMASFSTLPRDYKQSLLQQICAVVSERTGRLCTRSIKCPQHSEDQRAEVRSQLLRDKRSNDDITPPPSKRSKDRSHKPSPDLTEELDVETHYTPGHSHYPPSESVLVPSKKKKSKSGKKSRKGHSSNSGGGGGNDVHSMF